MVKQKFNISKNLLVKNLVARYQNRIGLYKCKHTRVQLIYLGRALDGTKTLGDYILNNDDDLVFLAIVRQARC